MSNTFKGLGGALFILLIIFCFATCKTDPTVVDGAGGTTTTTPTVEKKRVIVPKFDKMSAFNFIQKQVDFGPRVMNSTGHEECKKWLVETFKGFGAEVIEQNFTANLYTGKSAPATNIIAQFNPEHKRRVVLGAHWDTRHIADHDPDPKNYNTPILGADDAGSGVGVLLEIARLIQENPIDLGVDMVLFDAEDYGDESDEGTDNTLTWCLGSQYWAKNLHRPDYKPKFGILLDMVGAKGAQFRKESTSMRYAPRIMNKVWNMAKGMGYSQFFVDEQVAGAVDDHLFVNEYAKIKMIDIIYKRDSGFGDHWHTVKDDMSIIDPKTLRAAGQVTLAVIYNESGGMF